MKILSSQYLKGAAKFEDCVMFDIDQIAVCGKSNVGKSSFINTLCGDGKLARTGKLPGRTRLINYFIVNDKKPNSFVLCDLPGYGFAKVSDAEKVKWSVLIEKYFASNMAKHIMFLVDIRHSPTKEDQQMMKYLYVNNCPFTIVATKADKVSKSQVKNRLRSIANELGVGIDNMMAFSSLTGFGKEQLLNKIEQILTVVPQEIDA